MNWISVKDRLPDTSRTVLVKADIYQCAFYHYDRKLEAWFDTYCQDVIKGVTHWCEITEPDKRTSAKNAQVGG